MIMRKNFAGGATSGKPATRRAASSSKLDISGRTYNQNIGLSVAVNTIVIGAPASQLQVADPQAA